MSLKLEIETWVQALAYYDNQEYDEAIKVFDGIADTSKILFNCGVIYATLGEHEKAVECYQRAIGLDQYLAIAYFQSGVSNFLLGDFEEALVNFNDTLLYLRGNTSIDYEQLGLKFRLYSCEVLFNRGLSYIYLRQMEPGMQDLEYAAKEKVTPDHDVIDDAIREQAEGYTVFSIPVGVVYRPNEAKVKNLKAKDYLGKAKLVAASDRNNTFTGFQAYEMKQSQASWAKATDDRPPEAISFAATNLVQKNLTSRSRQQSEPPLNRNMFPPTPPPDMDKSSNSGSSAISGGGGMTQRAASVRSGGRPPRLNLEQTGLKGSGRAMDDPRTMERERPRIGTTRTASEPRGPASRQNTRGYGSSRDGGRQPLYRETTPQRRNMGDSSEYVDDVYDLYSSPRSVANNNSSNNNRRGVLRQQPEYIDEEEEYASDLYEEDGTFNEGEFEMVGAPTSRTRVRSSSRGPPHRGPSRRQLEVRKFRVKVHAAEDTRYIMIGPDLDFGEFEGRIRDKFGFRSRLRIKMQDDGDMITMGDQDDLEMLLMSAKEIARREGSDMAKMEIWVEERL